CLLVRGKTSPLLLWIPLEDLAKELDPSFDQRLFFLLTTLATVVCVQALLTVEGSGWLIEQICHGFLHDQHSIQYFYWSDVKQQAKMYLNSQALA
ncbi:unnamed protein product, partial [Symbiodinium microadriaticum]